MCQGSLFSVFETLIVQIDDAAKRIGCETVVPVCTDTCLLMITC